MPRLIPRPSGYLRSGLNGGAFHTPTVGSRTSAPSPPLQTTRPQLPRRLVPRQPRCSTWWRLSPHLVHRCCWFSIVALLLAPNDVGSALEQRPLILSMDRARCRLMAEGGTAGRIPGVLGSGGSHWQFQARPRDQLPQRGFSGACRAASAPVTQKFELCMHATYNRLRSRAPPRGADRGHDYPRPSLQLAACLDPGTSEPVALAQWVRLPPRVCPIGLNPRWSNPDMGRHHYDLHKGRRIPSIFVRLNRKSATLLARGRWSPRPCFVRPGFHMGDLSACLSQGRASMF